MRIGWRWAGRGAPGALLILFACVGCAGGSGNASGKGGVPPGPGRPPRDFDFEEAETMRARSEAMQVLDVEWLWTEISFRFDLTPEQKAECSEAIREAWTERNAYLAYADRQERPDWKVITKQLETARKRVEDRLQAVLPAETWEELKALEWRRNERRRTWMMTGLQ